MNTRAFVIALGMLRSTPAWATANFPPAIAETFGLSRAPACTLCHRGTPKSDTATTAFAIAMQDRGLQAYSVATLTSALDAMRVDQIDSDGDGTLDVDELAAGQDPNENVPGPPEPFFGCGLGNGELVMLAPFVLLRRRRGAHGACS
ncbi:MAG: hypothetical protein ACKVPX_15095 [Myxococcaceae bacterium]